MNAELLLSHFDRIADAPDAVARLRKFILDLAVRGKLVKQDPTDTLATELLKEIRTEEIRLVKTGGIRKQAPKAPIKHDETSFDLPTGWCWVRLGEIIRLVSGQHLQPHEYSDQKDGGIPYITGPADFGVDGLVITRYALVRKAVAEKGQILLTVKGAGVGKTATCDLKEVAISRQLMAMTAILWSQQFLLLVTHRLAEVLKDSARSLIPGISREDVDGFVFPLPPLAEQHRIVAKVDELMALCDRLEAAQRKRESRRDRLAASTHHHLNNGADAEALRSRAQFFISNLPRFSTRPDQIKQLRQTILNLAVRGKLAEQNPKEESILATVRSFVPSFMEHDQITPNDSGAIVHHVLPTGWAWIKGKWIADFVDPQPSHRTPPQIRDGVPYIGYADITERGTIDFLNARKVSDSVLEEHRQRYTLNVGDFIIGKIGTIGEPFLLPCPFEYTLSANIILVQPKGYLVLPKYLMLFLNSPIAKTTLVKLQTDSTHAVFGIKKARELLFPLPPLPEQHRIVAKVDELMTLCDQLEASLTTAQTESSGLLESVLHHALA